MLSTTEPPHSPSLSHSDSKSLCRSQASSHSSSSQPLLAQIAQLKQKAHQSFMQVMQMQQLHEQELQLLRNDQAQRQEGLLQRIQELQEGIQRQEGLELRVKQLENENLEMERNWRLRFCEMEEDLSIDSVQPIPGKDEGTDDEEVSHLREVLQLYSNEEEFQAVKEQMVKELQQIGGNSNVEISSSGGNTPQSPLPELIRKVLAYVSSLRKECSRLLLAERQHEGKQKVAKSPVKEPATAGSPSKEIERLEREGKFMAEHIKRLSTDKLRAQKRTAEAERELKIVQDKIGKATSALSKKGINLDGLLQGTTTRVLDHDHSLQLDEFVSQNLRNSFKSHPIASPLKPHQPLLAKTTHR